MALQIPVTAGFVAIDTGTPKTITVPLSTDRLGRILTFKDRTGQAATNNITLQTQGSDVFDNGATTYKIDQPYGTVTVISRSGQWLIQVGYERVYVSTIQANYFIGNGSLLTALPAGAVLSTNLTSTVQGLGSANYVSTLSLVSTTQGLQNSYATAGFLSTANLTSTVQGLGSANYVSTLSLVSTTQGLQNSYTTAGFLSTANLTSTVQGLGSAGYISSSQLISTVAGLNTYTSSFIDTAELNSTVQGLGSANYVSTLSLVSTTQGLQNSYATAGFLSTANLTSTVAGLGTAGYLSTTALGPFFSSMSTSYALNFITSSLTFSTATGSNATISSVTANQFTVGTNGGWLLTGALQTAILSSIQINTNLLYANSNFFGTVSSQTALQFYGLQGNYNNTVIAEQSTGTGTQELLLFKGSSASDQVRIQTTGGFRLETGVSSRLWPTYAQAANPALYVDINSNVGIGTASPGALLDVVGQGRFQVVSTLQLNISSINGATFGSPINSTVIGLGSAGYVSTLSLVSTTAGIIANISITGVLSTANLTSTVQGLGSANYVSTLSLVSTTAGILNNISITGVLSTANLTSTVQGLGSANYVSTLSLVSTTQGLQTGYATAGFLSTPNLTSTVQGLGSANYVSTLSLVSTTQGLQTGYATAGFLSTPNLTSTVQGLGSANYVSTLSLVSTTQGVQTGYATAGFLSTPNLTSTVQGLGSAGYVSTTALGPFFSSMSTSYAVNFITSSLTFSTATGSNATISSVTANQILFGTGNGWIQAGAIQTTVLSSVQLNTNSLYANSNFFGTVSSQTALQFYGLQGNYNNTVIAEQSTGTGTQELLLFKGSSASDQVRIQTTGGFRLETGVSSRLWPTYAQAANPALYVDINSNVGIGTASPGALLDVVGQGRFQVVSTLQLNISSINGATFGSPINSTVIGLGSAGYVSTLSLVSTTAGILNNISITGVLSTANLTSTVQGLGSANYVSTLSLVSTTAGIIANISVTGVLSTANLTSTVQGLGSVGYISSSQLISTTEGLTNYISTFIDPTELTSTVIGLGTTGFISSIGLDAKLASTTQGLGSAGYISSSQLISTVAGLNTYASSFIDTAELASSINSLGTLGYVSTLSLVSTTQGLQTGYATAGFLSTANLTSTVQGLGSANYVSTLSLVSTTQGLQTGYATAGFLSTPNLTSTVQGLGSANYVSTLSLVSTTQGLQTGYATAGFLSTPNLTSTVQGLGTAGYVSTTALGAYFSSVSTSYALNFITSSLTFSTATGSNATISTVTTNQFTVGSNGGWILAGALQTVVLSSVQINTNVLYANSNFFGTVSSQTALQFYGLQGNYNNTVIAEQSTGTGTQELLLFKGSSASDQVRIQTTGGFRLETGVSSRLWPTYAQAANPALYVDINSNVGIGTASPGALLDVVGQGRFQVVSTLQLNISSINGATFGSPINSTVIGLGSAGYVSTLSLVSTTAGIIANISITGVLSTANLTSTVQGLGSANYVSTLSLVSTTQGLQTSYATAGFLSTANLTSTVQGLGSANYVSTLSLVSTTQGLQNSYATAGFLSTANLTSTVQGLGSANYVSTLSLVSTTQGLQTGYATAGFLSTANLTSTVAGLGTAGYVSTTALGPYFSSVSTSYALSFTTSSLIFSTATGSNATISSVTANQFTVGTNGGWLLTGALQTAILSSIQINTNLLYANSNFFGTVSSQTALQFYGLQGNYNNTVITEQSTGTGTQELLLFKGSSASDQVRIQTTGGFRLETGVSSRLWPTYAQAANPALYVDINSNVGIGTASPGALLDVVGQGRFQVVSTLQLNISSINGATFGSPINSTVIGLGSAGYVSTLSLVSTTQGLQTGYATAGFLSTANLTSTVQGLGSANYVSTLSLVSTTQGLQNSYATAGFLSTANLTSTVAGLGTAGYISTTALGAYFSSVSTSYALNFVTSSLTFSTATGSTATVSSLTVNQLTFGTGSGWVQFGAVQAVALSSIQLNTNSLYANSNFFGTVSSQTALQFYGLQGNYNNTVIAEQSTGTGTQELLLFKGSSASDQVRIQTTGGFRLETGVSSRLWPTYAQPANPALYVDINSNVGIGTASPGALLDVVGQGRFQVVSTLQLNISSINGATFGSPINSTVIGLGSAGYVSTLSLVSTTQGLQRGYQTAGFISTANEVSTVVGLGSAGYVSTLSLVSTTQGLQTGYTTAGFLSTANLTSTVAGLGTAGYLSSASIGPLFSSMSTSYALNFITSSLTFSTATGSNATISTVTTNQLTVGSNGGWLLTGAIQTAIMSSVQINTNLLYTNSNFFGTVSSQTAVQFYGLQGNYNNTVIAEQSTGTGTQELLLFKGSSASDQVRIQTTGGFRLETGVSSRLWPTYAQPANPALYVDINSNVGIGTASPGALLDVVGQGRFQVVSTLQLNISSINGATFGSPINSTVIGLGTAGYVSSLSLVSTTQGLQRGYQTAGFISTANEVSTVVGLGSAGYVSTLSLVSTTQGLQTAYTTAGFLSTANLTSTVAGLGTAGYLSTTALGAYFSSVSTSYALNFITSSLTFSTATGSNATISTVTTNQVGIGSNGGWLQTGALQAIAVSSIQLNTNVLYANSNFFGTVSSQTALQFYGLLGNYNNTVIAEQSTGTGTQELLLFKGSSASDQVRIQTTGGFRLETGVSSRLWPTYAQPANPAVYVDINSNVGIGTASPAALLDVVGQGRFQVVSTLQLNISSINGATFGSPINSTVIGLGSAGYLSSSALGPYFSSVSTSYALKFITSSITASSITTSSFSTFQGAASTFTLDILQFATGTGWLGMGPIQPYAVSTIVTNTSTLCVGMATSVFPFDVGSMAHMSSLMLGGSALSTANAYSLAVFGDAAKTTGTSWTAISDKRIKDNIAEADYTICYNDIKKLPLRRYTYSSSMIETYSLKDKRVLGFIAQEVSTIQPKSITLAPILNIDDAMWLNTEQVFFSLYGTVKKVLFDKEILESTTKSLVTLNTNLTQRVSTLEGLVVRSLGGNV